MCYLGERKNEESGVGVKRLSGIVKYLLIMLVSLGTAMIILSNAASADVIYEPEDDFYASHYSECRSCERYYVANGYNGKVIIYKSPKRNKAVAEYENGKSIYVCYTYTDKNDIKWGLIDNEGWFPMDYAYPLYDAVSFNQAYSSEFVYPEDGENEKIVETGESFYLYSFPGATYSGYLYTNGDEWGPSASQYYTDPFGYEWGYVSYYYSSRGWVCLSHPDYTFEELYPDGQSFSGITEIPEECDIKIIPGKKPSSSNDSKDNDDDRDEEEDSSYAGLWVVVIIAAVVVVSVGAAVVIIFVIKKNNKRNNKGNN